VETKELQLKKDMVGNISLTNDRYQYDYKGFTSIINQIIELVYLHYTMYNNYNVIINDSQVIEFFDPINENLNSHEIYNVSDIFFNLIDSNKWILSEFTAHTVANLDDLKKRNLKNFLKFKSSYLEMYNKIKLDLFKNYKVLGIHIRGTDKSTELPKIPIGNIFKYIDEAMNNGESYDKLFVATDDYEYLNQLINKYGDDFVIYNKSHSISHNGQPLHRNNTPEYRKKLNFEVLIDAHLLSETDYFLYCFSNVSLLSLSLMSNPENKIKNINL
jgi:hypothetical protein